MRCVCVLFVQKTVVYKTLRSVCRRLLVCVCGCFVYMLWCLCVLRVYIVLFFVLAWRPDGGSPFPIGKQGGGGALVSYSLQKVKKVIG